MESIALDFHPESLDKYNKYFIPVAVVLGVANIVLAFKGNGPSQYIPLLTFVIVMVQAYVIWRNHMPRIVVWDESGIQGDGPLGKKILLKWEEVATIDASLFSIDIRPKTEVVVHLALSQITYNQQREVKPQILALARVHGIEVWAPLHVVQPDATRTSWRTP